jgi:YfiH family protein
MMPQVFSPPNIDLPAGFFSRHGGVSHGVYSSLNCGPGSNDDTMNVDENRRIAAAEISGRRDTAILSCYQIHSNQVVTATGDWGEDRPKADAIVTSRPGIILGILTADCTPVLFADEKAGVIGAAHAGWKGALTGVLANTVAAMEKLGATRGNINAAVGPTIHQPSYEVTSPFVAAFTDEAPSHQAFFSAGQDNDHWQFDLPGFVLNQLKKQQIGNIWHADIDTYTSTDHFSYRETTHKKEADYGRQLSAIMLRS